jgi:hypothetical protein
MSDASTDAAAGPVDAGVRPSLPEGDCDPLDPTACALPWPSNLYLRADSARRTGHTLRFGPTSLPANLREAHVDPLPFERLDGYGVGTPIMAYLGDVDLSAMATEGHPERSMADDAAALLFEVQGERLVRVPYFVELDSQARGPARRVLFLRPLVILKEATRYVVAFRGLRTTAGAAVAPSPAFERLRAGTTMGDPALGPRQARFNTMFAQLEAAGVPRQSLTLAWDFNTPARRHLHGPLLRHARRRADAAPPGAHHHRHGHPGPPSPDARHEGREVNEHIALEITGTIEVPHYMRPRRFGTTPGWVLNVDAQGRPWRTARARWSFCAGAALGGQRAAARARAVRPRPARRRRGGARGLQRPHRQHAQPHLLQHRPHRHEHRRRALGAANPPRRHGLSSRRRPTAAGHGAVGDARPQRAQQLAALPAITSPRRAGEPRRALLLGHLAGRDFRRHLRRHLARHHPRAPRGAGQQLRHAPAPLAGLQRLLRPAAHAPTPTPSIRPWCWARFSSTGIAPTR